jgi:diguanylate cyclase (GGDEF)-like protein/PAS domain S-box-containing protein/putative nucleotidyltransferase with HDIG domain
MALMRPGGRSGAGGSDAGCRRLREQAAVLRQVRDGVALLDREGVIVEVNPQLCAITGFDAEELVGSGFPYPFSTGGDDELALTGGSRRAQRQLRRKNGNPLYVSASVAPVLGPDGEPEGRAAVLEDLSESLVSARLEETVREVAAASVSGEIDNERAVAGMVASRLAQLVDTATAAVIRYDYDAQQAIVVGFKGSDPGPARFSLTEPTAAAEVARTGHLARFDGYGTRGGLMAELADEHALGRCVVAVPVWMQGSLWGCVAASSRRPGGFTDAQELLLERFAALVASSLANVQAQVRLRERAFILDSLRDGLVVLDAEGRIAEVNEPLCRMTGFGYDELVGTVAPFPFSSGSGDELELTESGSGVELTLRRADGRPLFVAASVGELVDGDGVPTGRAAVVTDISDSVFYARSERALGEVAAACAATDLDVDRFFDMVTDRVSELLEMSARVVRLADGRAQSVSSRGALPAEIERVLIDGMLLRDGPGTALAPPADAPGLQARLERAIAETPVPSALVAPIRVGDEVWGMLIVASEIPGSLGDVAGRLLRRFAGLAAVGVVRARTLATLQVQATTDGLTGLLNHRSFQERLQDERRRAIRYGRPLALALFDLDGFKEVNDTRGHPTGDRVLATVARALERASRANDVAARIGGDEFAVIAPDTDLRDAEALTERLRLAAVAALERLELPVTLSAGVAELNGETKIDDLVHNADGALYWAKHHGRNRTVRATPRGLDEVESTMEQERERQAARARALAGLRALARAVDAKDASTRRHSERVAELCEAIAIELGWGDERATRLREAALMHDVGKIGVPDALLAKPGRYTRAEREQVMAHARIGAQIVREVLDEEQVSWVRSHHERPDGGGYPDGLDAATIPAGALVLAVADAFDAIVTGRTYQPARSAKHALAELRDHIGSQFDRTAVEALAAWLAREERSSREAR